MLINRQTPDPQLKTQNLKLIIVLTALVGLPLLLYTLSLLRLMAATVVYPWELDQGEGHNVWSAWLLLHGRGPYLDLNHYPFFDINYPPLHFVTMIPLLWIFGPSLTAGRLLADFYVFALAGGVGAVVWRYSRQNRLATGLGVLLILANPYLYIFGTLATVNVSQVAFGLWGLYWLGRALDEVGPDGVVQPAAKVNYRALVAGLLLLLAALYTKQQALDAVLAGFLFFLWRKPRLAVIGAVAFGVVGGGLFLLIDLLTAHQFYTNLIKVNLNDYLKRQLLDQGTAYALTHAPLLLLAVFYVVRTLQTRARLSLWLIYLLSTAAFSVTVGKFGASETYFYASIAAVAIAASLATAQILQEFSIFDFRFSIFGFFRDQRSEVRGQELTEVRDQKPQLSNAEIQSKIENQKSPVPVWGKILPIALVVLLCLQNVLFYHTPETPHPWKSFIKGHSGNYVLFGGLPSTEERAAGQRLADAIKAAPQPVLTEEASFAMINGYEVVTNPSNILVFNKAKLWQGQELTGMVANRCFSLVLLHGHFLPTPVQDQIHSNYHKAEVERLNGDNYELWARNSDPSPSSTCPNSN